MSTLRPLQLQARAAMQARQLPQAQALLLQAAQQTNAREADYAAMLADLREVLRAQRLARAALSVDWYLGDTARQAEMLGHVPLVDQARTVSSWGEREPDRARATMHFARAAELYERAELPTHAAIARERSGDWRAARSLWSRLADLLARQGTQAYPAGLARFNLARACLQLEDAPATRSAVVGAVHLLEQAADEYETVGQRERAFDCYQVLIAIGRQSGQFEHVLEGYVNVGRILREDHLRYYALQSHEEAIEAAREAGELAAAATLASELGSYAASQGLPSVANHAGRMRAWAWAELARRATERGAPPEIAENALLAALVVLAPLGQFAEVGRLYATLAQLGIDPARRAHYARASRRYEAQTNAPLDAGPLPSHLRQQNPTPDVWHVDLIEWEQSGSASAATGDVMLDRDGASEVTRRRALLARLVALDVDAAAEARAAAPEATLVTLAELLGRVEIYSILSPLERLYQSGTGSVRLAVMRSMERLLYKRSFVTVRAGLSDADESVRAQACRAVEALRFPHAFDVLGRIYREADAEPARAAALGAIARIDTHEAAELLLGVFLHEDSDEQRVVAEALKKSRGTSFVELARSSWSTLERSAQEAVRDVLRARGESL